MARCMLVSRAIACFVCPRKAQVTVAVTPLPLASSCQDQLTRPLLGAVCAEPWKVAGERPVECTTEPELTVRESVFCLSRVHRVPTYKKSSISVMPRFPRACILIFYKRNQQPINQDSTGKGRQESRCASSWPTSRARTAT